MATKQTKNPGGGVHPEHEDHPWTINVGDHPTRTDSPLYTRSRALMIEIVKTTQPWFLGNRPYQDHHGGGLWVKDQQGWLLLQGLAGIEWSAQFCADPAKIEALRQFAERLIAAFPDTLPGYKELAYDDAEAILAAPITNADGVAAWTDSIFNASVPLPADKHTGVLPKGAGYHHYPKPIVDIETFKYDDFELFVTDAAGLEVAVTPVGRRGSGDDRVRVAWANPASKYASQPVEAETKQVLEFNRTLASQAFRRQ